MQTSLERIAHRERHQIGSPSRTKGVDYTILERLSKALGIDNPLHLLEYVFDKGAWGLQPMRKSLAATTSERWLGP